MKCMRRHQHNDKRYMHHVWVGSRWEILLKYDSSSNYRMGNVRIPKDIGFLMGSWFIILRSLFQNQDTVLLFHYILRWKFWPVAISRSDSETFCKFGHKCISQIIWKLPSMHTRWIGFTPSEMHPHMPPELQELYELYQLEAQYANGDRDGKYDVHNLLRVSVPCWCMVREKKVVIPVL